MNGENLVAEAMFLFFVLISAFVMTRFFFKQRQEKELVRRLERLIAFKEKDHSRELPMKERPQQDKLAANPKRSQLLQFSFLSKLKVWHEQSGLKMNFSELLSLLTAATLLCFAILFFFELPTLPALGFSLALPLLSCLLLRYKAAKRRDRFVEQLPNAIDLMISILRSGHSVPQSVRSVAEESPDPLGIEFKEIFQRMNLGQSFPEALKYSVQRFDSFELDLLSRAAAIQQEVGGSLAELLEKTNSTLRQRIKLKNQVHLLTGQGRLSALICGLLPVLIACFFQQINPDYLEPLFKTNSGQILLALALLLELAGFLIMRKLSSSRI